MSEDGYQDYAIRCLELAKTIAHRPSRMILREMAAEWLSLTGSSGTEIGQQPSAGHRIMIGGAGDVIPVEGRKRACNECSAEMRHRAQEPSGQADFSVAMTATMSLRNRYNAALFQRGR